MQEKIELTILIPVRDEEENVHIISAEIKDNIHTKEYELLFINFETIGKIIQVTHN